MHSSRSPRKTVRLPVVVLLTAAAAITSVSTSSVRFYKDDPIAREPEPEDASGAAPGDIGLTYEMAVGLFATPGRTPTNTRAQNINTIDEVPDSSWFTNRIGAVPLSLDAIERGPIAGAPPAPEKWTIIREKASGYAPGFTARGARGETWFLSFDPPSNPEGATAAVSVANKIFWALGYNQVETFITTVDPNRIEIDPKATRRRPSGARTPFTRSDVDEVLGRAYRNAEGTYRAAASRLLPGKILGPFRYEGTRPDDPNDIVPHEHRRELRALRVFGAWTNLTDLKAGNTLDALVTENGRGIVKHYLQDVGSTFGMGANGPHDWDEGYEYFYEPDSTKRRLFTFGFARSPWQSAPYTIYPAVGRFEGDAFDPRTWKPHWATQAYIEMRADDAFWAARRVVAFTDDAIRAAVKTGRFSDAAAEQYLADALIKRRDKIARAYLTDINPVVDPRLDAGGTLSFANAAVDAKVAEPPTEYRAAWHVFDNATGTTRPLGDTRSATTQLSAPRDLPSTSGSFIEVHLSAESAAYPSWKVPVRIHFRREGGSWKLVGLQRAPDTPETTQADRPAPGTPR
jgi:hypothetical protein